MKIERYQYTHEHLTADKLSQLSQAFPLSQSNEITWIDIDGHLSSDDFAALAKGLQLHALEVDEFVRKRHRPRIDYYANHLALSLKMLQPSTGSEHLFLSESVTMIMGEQYLVTIQSGKNGDVFDGIREELANPQSRLRDLGVDYLLYRVLAVVVNNYFAVLEVLDEKVEKLEELLVDHTDQQAANRLYKAKRELVVLRKAVWPLREVVLSIERTPSKFIQPDTQVYFRDVYEQTIQVIDTVESLRDLMSGMIEIYLSSLSNRMNSVIKVLTIITTIFMPLTLITGIFGMNFQYLPGLESAMGPWEVMGGMLVTAIAMIIVFRFKKWLWNLNWLFDAAVEQWVK